MHAWEVLRVEPRRCNFHKERKIILGSFPGGVWGCCLGYQVPKLEIKRLGDAWEKLQGESSR